MVSRARFSEGLSRLFDRAALFARGGDRQQQAARDALAAGRPLEARTLARELAEQMPDSPSVLALWAETAAACGLDEEATQVLMRLAERVPWRHEVWIAVARANDTILDPRVEEALFRASESSDPAVRREAAFCLIDSDLARGLPHRGLRWLERVAHHASQPDPDRARRRAECLLAMGRARQAEVVARKLPERPGDPRQCLLMAKLEYGRHGATDDAVKHALRAHVLGDEEAESLLLDLVVDGSEPEAAAKIRSVIESEGRGQRPCWRAAFSLLDGDEASAQQELRRAVKDGDDTVARCLLVWARSRGSWEIVDELAASDALGGADRELASLAMRARQSPATVLADAMTMRSGVAQRWCEAAVGLAIEHLLPVDAEANWPAIFERLRAACVTLACPSERERVKSLVALERTQLRVAVIGEFSVGKTTLMNAWLGSEVGPVGIKPTTAYATWLAHAPDDYATVEISGGPDRVVSHERLRECLASQKEDVEVRRVLIFSQQHELEHIVLLDTPGFNAGVSEHELRAWQAVDEADLVVWVSDATAPLKDSERRVLKGVGERGLPVQIVLNKIDRLAPSERESVLRYVQAHTGELGVSLVSEPFGMSARDALRDRAGGAAGWAAWRSFVEEELMAGASWHIERAMRRRAKAAVRRLLLESGVRGPVAPESRQASLEAFAERCKVQGGELARELTDALGDALGSLRDDLEPLRQLDADGLPSDAQDYVIDRSLARLLSPLCRAFDGIAQGVMESALRTVARSVFYGVVVAAAASSRSPLTAARLQKPLAVALAEIGEQLQTTLPDIDAGVDAMCFELECFARRLAQVGASLDEVPSCRDGDKKDADCDSEAFDS